MPGAVVIVIVLLLLPVVVCMSFALIAAAFGQLLYKDGEVRNEGSELHDRARLYLELCAKFTGFVRDEKAAQIVRRRAAA